MPPASKVLALTCAIHDMGYATAPRNAYRPSFNLKNSQGLIQPYLISLLNRSGRKLVSAIVRQGSTLYPAGARRLKDIVSNYSSLTGSHKWLLASIMLLVFRPVLQSTVSLVNFAMKSMWGVCFGTRSFVAGCRLSTADQPFAVRSRPSFAVFSVSLFFVWLIHLSSRSSIGACSRFRGVRGRKLGNLLARLESLGHRPVVLSVDTRRSSAATESLPQDKGTQQPGREVGDVRGRPGAATKTDAGGIQHVICRARAFFQ